MHVADRQLANAPPSLVLASRHPYLSPNIDRQLIGLDVALVQNFDGILNARLGVLCELDLAKRALACSQTK